MADERRYHMLDSRGHHGTNGTMAWRAVLLRAAEPDRNRSEQALAAVLLWAAFCVAVGVVVAWWATA